MDDLDHSVHIAERDWDSFFEESEECNVRLGALAGLDDSGLSDFDESEFRLSSREVLASQELNDSPSDLEGRPVEPSEGTKDLRDPVNVLTGGGNGQIENVFSESAAMSADDEDPAELSRATQASADSSEGHSLDKPQEALEQDGARCATRGVQVYQETARNRVDKIGSASRESEIQTNATAAINLFTESAPQGAIAFHASDCSDVKFVLSSLQAGNECEQGRDRDFSTVLGGPRGEMNLETDESSLASPSTSFLDPQKDSLMNAEALSDADISAGANHLSDRAGSQKTEKERWFVTVNLPQPHAREKNEPPAKKKKRRKKKSCSEEGPELGPGSKGRDPDVESNSGAERLGVFEPSRQEIGHNPEGGGVSDGEESRSNESASPIRTRRHKLKNHCAPVLSREPLPSLQTVREFEGHKVNCQNSQHAADHLEQPRVSVGSDLHINPALEGKLALEQNDSTPTSFQPVCPVSPGWTEASEPITAVNHNPPNHQNLMVKLLFPAQSDTGWEMLVFSKNSDQEDLALPLSRGERPSQDVAEAESCLAHSQTDSMPQRCAEGGAIYSETSIFSVESPENSNGRAVDATPGSSSLDGCLSADTQVDLQSKTFPPEVARITGASEPGGLIVSEINDGSGEFDWPKCFITPDEVHNSPEIQMGHTCPDQQVKDFNNELMCLEEDTGIPLTKFVIPERDSTLSATANPQPLTVTKKNSSFLTADQHSTEMKPHLEAALLHPVDTTVSDERAVERSPNESSVTTLRSSPDPGGNEDDLARDDPCRRSGSVSQADATENVSNQTFPEFPQPPLDPIEGKVQEIDSEDTLAEDSPTAPAHLSAVEAPECNIQSMAEDESVLPKESGTCAEDQASRELDVALDSTRPVYAISSFWDEMEKLTINDILHLRLVSNARHPGEFPHVQDNTAVADASDAADSGYFAHPDDSESDRWTGGGASLFSDFEDEFQPAPGPGEKPPVLWSMEPSCGTWWEGDPASAGGSANEAWGGGVDRPEAEDSISQHPLSDGTRSFRSLYKTATAQNMQTLEEEERSSTSTPVTAGGADESSMISRLHRRPVESCGLPLRGNDAIDSPLPPLSGRASPEVYVMALPEISKHFIGEHEAEIRLSDRASPISETSVSDGGSPTAYFLCETSLSDRESPTAYSLPENSQSDRSSPFAVSRPENSLSDRSSPIALSQPESSLSGTASPTAYPLPENSQSDRSSPFAVSRPENSQSGTASPNAYPLSETSLPDRASPTYSFHESSLSGRASPTVYPLSETSLSDRASPTYSFPESSLSSRASPTAYPLSETIISDSASPTAYPLPETSLFCRASPTVYSLSDIGLPDIGNPAALSLCETSLSGRVSPIACSLPEIRLSDRASPIVSLYHRAPSFLSLPETYDCFFSDFEAGNIFFPPIRRLGANTSVPIFSCSHSAKRELRLAEERDYVFPEGTTVDSDDEDGHTPIPVVTCFDDRALGPLDALVEPDAYGGHCFVDKDCPGSIFGRNLLSLRRVRFTGGLYTACDRSTSWAFAATAWRERSPLFSLTEAGDPVDVRSRSHSHPNLYMENQLCNELWEPRDTGVQAVVSLPKRGFLFTLRQSDICLVCIAFASWVLKSANPQSADTWKTALLANVSAISAIQYLRRYMQEDASGNRR